MSSEYDAYFEKYLSDELDGCFDFDAYYGEDQDLAANSCDTSGARTEGPAQVPYLAPYSGTSAEPEGAPWSGEVSTGTPLHEEKQATLHRAGQSKLGCGDRKPFETYKLLDQHTKNIHRNPLLCTIQGCDYRKPFGKHSDLDRHKEEQARGVP
ncbi:hypothetical protein B0H66DRAFT_607552 [Apodospora peruviana]|uniref:C2H2-type domain-containing protein n=1 Tax=Apodospora peruviana TaxID=516989 RepID=A0AAE0HWT0_9PEZI|nr:hypothetical protein B0H66DRAFT_607552 [Apodospora peruviana]